MCVWMRKCGRSSPPGLGSFATRLPFPASYMLKPVYIFIYNVGQFIGWALTLATLIKALASGGDVSTMVSEAGAYTSERS